MLDEQGNPVPATEAASGGAVIGPDGADVAAPAATGGNPVEVTVTTTGQGTGNDAAATVEPTADVEPDAEQPALLKAVFDALHQLRVEILDPIRAKVEELTGRVDTVEANQAAADQAKPADVPAPAEAPAPATDSLSADAELAALDEALGLDGPTSTNPNPPSV